MLDAVLAIPDLAWREKLAYLAFKFHKLPQNPMPVVETYEDGQYVREIRIPADTVFIGKPHRHGHECQLLSGKVVHITPEGKTEIEAPFTMHSTPGYQVVLYAITDVVGKTIHPGWMTEVDIAEPLETVLAEGYLVNERIEYAKMMRHYGVDEDAFRPLMVSEADQIPFPSSSRVEVGDSRIQGKGILATSDIEGCELVAPARLGGKRTPAGRYTNHAFEPNAQFVPLQNGDLVLMSIKPIAKGEEVTIDYREAVKASAGVQ